MTVIQHNTTYIIQYRFIFSCLCLLSFHHPKYSSIIPSFSKYSLFTVFLHPQLISFKNHHFCWNMLFGLLFNSHPALSPLASSHPSAPQAGTNSGASARREAAVAPAAPAAPLALAPAFACVIDHDAFTSQIGIWNCQANKQIWVYEYIDDFEHLGSFSFFCTCEWTYAPNMPLICPLVRNVYVRAFGQWHASKARMQDPSPAHQDVLTSYIVLAKLYK